MKPLAVDLCCGKGGWTRGLQAAGFRVVGVDLAHWPDYPGEYFVKQDIRTLSGAQFRGAALIVASPPCEEFSYRSFPFKRCREVGPPDLGIELFRACERIGQEAGVPYVIENVRGARKWVGPAQMHLGPFYLWGTGIPALWPVELRKVVKGFTRSDTKKPGSRQAYLRRACDGRRYKADPKDDKAGMGNMSYLRQTGAAFDEMERADRPSRGQRHGDFAMGEQAQWGSSSTRRKEWSATIAMIPFELARTVGECHYPVQRCDT